MKKHLTLQQKFKQLHLRKLLLLFMLFAGISISTKANVTNYTFASSSGTYTPISGTVLYTGSWDDGASALLTIPFSFKFNDLFFNSLSVTANGFLTFGAIPNGNIYCGLQNSPSNSIAGYGTDLVASGAASTVQYSTLGSTPNRQFVVQWTNTKHYSGSASDLWTFQIILNESDNSVQVVYGTTSDATTMGANTCADVATESGNVGLKGGNDFNIRSVTNGTNTWATSVAGAALTDVCNMSATNVPASGLTYTWTPLPPSNMVYVSSTTTFVNNGGNVQLGSTNKAIYRVEVSTTGSLSPLSVTNLALSTAGCTNASTDINNAKVFFTGTSSSFSTTTQFGATVANPNGVYAVSGSAILGEGINYFWIAYDIKATATLNNTLTGCCTSITGSGSMGIQIPTVTCPAGAQTIMNIGLWTPVAALAPHANLGGMLLLSDGTVICHSNGGGGSGKIYDKLTPDASGSYANGTWSSIAPMFNDRLFYSSQVLQDGRVYVAGGEYGAGLAKGEVYDPLTNAWTLTPNPGVNLSDANSEILPDGKILQAVVDGAVSPFLRTTKIYDPVTNTYATGPTALGIHNESVWIKLPDNSVLYVDRLSTASERYIPATNTWVADATVPVALYDPFGDETGAAVLLPDGRAFFIGSIGFTAFYTPSGNSSPGVWTAGPTIPGSHGAPDAPAAMMANGKVLLALGNVPTSSSNIFDPPCYFYEFDYITNTYTQLLAPDGNPTHNIGCYQASFLNLPDGSILYGQNQSSASSRYYVYTPSGAQTVSGKPVVNNIISLSCDSFRIVGNKFNGISQGSSYGDDWQMSTNYPVIRLTSGSNVYYCRSFNWNSTGVSRGSALDTAYFKLPAGLPAGAYSLVVTANGIASDPVAFNTALSPAITGTTSFCAGGSTTLDAGSFTSYLWSTGSVSQTITVNTAATFTVTVTSSGGCTGTASATTTVNALPVVTASNVSGCTGNPIALSGTPSGGTFSVANPYTGPATNYTYSFTDGNGCSNTSAAATISINVAPTIAVCPANIIQCNNHVVMFSTPTATGTPNPTVVCSPASGSTFVTGTTSVTCTATNTCGSDACSFNVTINETPVIAACPANIIQCNNHVVTFSTPTATGTPNPTVVCSPASGSTFVTGTTSVTCTATNTCGSDACSFNVTINETPVIAACPADINTTGLAGGSVVNYTPPTATGTPTASVVCTPASGSTFAIGTTIVNCVATNSCGSSNCSFNVNVSLSCTAPVISGCPIDVIQCNDAVVNWTNPIATGTTPTIVCSPASGSTFANGTTTVTCTATNGCGSDACSFDVTYSSAPPSSTVSIVSAPANGCSGNVVTVSTNLVPDALTYNWSAPAGCLINGLTSPQTTLSNTVSITLGPIPGNSSGWQICAFAANACGQTNTSCNWIRGQLSTPAPITGSRVACPNTGDSYSTTAVSGATSYSWTITGDATVSGTGTTASVSFGPGFTSGVLCVKAELPCGYQSGSRCMTIVNGIPQLGAMTGTFIVCPGATGVPFGVPASPGATTYNWTLPTGATIVNGAGTNNITVNFGSGYSAGNICVIATSVCGINSLPRCKTIGSNTANTPGNVTGGLFGVCGQTISYSIAGVSGATGYTWTAPSGSTFGTVNGNNTIDVIYSPLFSSGQLCVTADNGCGSSAPRCVNAKGIPSNPPIIAGLSSVCAFDAGISYSIAPVFGSIGYVWTVPSDASIVSGQGTTSIIVDWGASGGTIGVTASGSCGNSGTRTLNVTMNCKLSSTPLSNATISVYPNPVSTNLTIEMEVTTDGTYTLELVDVSGRIVKAESMKTSSGLNRNQLNVSNLSKGMYLLRVQNLSGFSQQVMIAIE